MLSKALSPEGTATSPSDSRSKFWLLTIGCVGVVYGDIGTSPLYAFREAAIQTAKHGTLGAFEIYGLLSLILWALIIVVTLKYVLFLLRVDNRGEGGILSLMALAQKAAIRKPGFIFVLGMIGAALFYGDAAITPAISVLSAVEGLNLVTPALASFILPISLLILVCLFAVQKNGTGKVSVLFGPITTIWFLAIGISGLVWIFKNPSILLSFNPIYGIDFLLHHGVLSLVILGAVFLAVTGAEALYADLGHFGLKPIQTAWLFLVFPCLALNYLGQGSLILENPSALENPFYLMVPEGALLPMVGLATMATIIASQAVITGAYSITQQAIQLGLLPRMEIRHTSADQAGQIFMPKINLLLLLAVLFLCILFGSSSALASAYGIAVTGTMIVTTILAFFVVWKAWKKRAALAACLIAPFLLIEGVFLYANMMKVFEGGIVPLVFAGFLVLLMMVWVKGTRYLKSKARAEAISLSDLMERMERTPPVRVAGTAIFLTSDPANAPIALLQNLQHNKILHDQNIVLAVITTETPKVLDDHRITIEPISSAITRVFISFGYMETPDVPAALSLARHQGLNVDLDKVSYFLGKRSIISDPRRGLNEWQDHIYMALAHSAATATDFYRIPPSQAVEMGVQIAV